VAIVAAADDQQIRAGLLWGGRRDVGRLRARRRREQDCDADGDAVDDGTTVHQGPQGDGFGRESYTHAENRKSGGR
jgi:hypothetical protein